MTVGTDGSTSYNYTVGEYPNRSNYVRVSEVVLPTNNYLANDGITVNTDSTGTSYSASLPIATSGSFCSASGSVKSGAVFFKDITTSANNSQGVEAANYSTALSLLSNKDEYQFNIISTPGLLRGNSEFTSTVDSVITLAEERGDCIAVVDLVGPDSQIVDATGAAVALNSSYAATYWPWLQINSATGRNEWIPAGTVIPGVYAFTDASSAPWFAPAGLVRGGIGGIIQAERKLTKGNRDTLYAAKVNPIATFPGSGISIMGQKTLQTKASALDRVNVRRLLIELKKFIGDQARNLVFEQNTIATRNRFLATVNPYLESVIQRQGLYAYRVVMDDTNNTADVVDRNQLIGQVFIQPTKTVEFVVLDFTIEPTGATFA
jgi:phage tail sheath protein FI